MKYSAKMERCGLSPMRKFAPYAVTAEKRDAKSIISISASQILKHRRFILTP